MDHLERCREEEAQLKARLAELEGRQAAEAPAVAEATEQCRATEEAITALNGDVTAIRADSSELKKRNTALKDSLATAALEISQATAEKENLAAQVVQSPARVRRELEAAAGSLDAEREEGLAAERRARATKACAENVAAATAGVAVVLKQIEEVEAELSKQHHAVGEVQSTHQTVAANTAKSGELRLALQSLDRQAHRADERLAHLRRTAATKLAAAASGTDAAHAELEAVRRQRLDHDRSADAVDEDASLMAAQIEADRVKMEKEREAMLAVFRRLEKTVDGYNRTISAALLEAQ